MLPDLLSKYSLSVLILLHETVVCFGKKAHRFLKEVCRNGVYGKRL